MTLTRKEIANILIETRNGRLSLDIATWLHDLDKASWPFLLTGAMKANSVVIANLGGEIEPNVKHYQHTGKPARCKKPKQDQIDTGECLPDYNWETVWLTRDMPPFWETHLGRLLPEKSGKVCVKYQYEEGGEIKKICRYFDHNEPSGLIADPFRYHSDDSELDKIFWPVFLISAAFGGPDGIDSDFFKSQFGLGLKTQAGEEQKTIPPKVATPFGREYPALGGKCCDEKQFATKSQ
jgi:hypothetical protein